MEHIVKSTKPRRILPAFVRRQFVVAKKYHPVKFSKLHENYEARLLENPQQIKAAKKLHAKIYLERGFVKKKDIEGGIIHKKKDHHQTHSDYFGVIDKKNGEVVAVARQIHTRNKGTYLPVISKLNLNKSYTYVDISEVVEISAFAKKRGVDSRTLLLLFYAMFQHSKQSNHRYWVLACDQKVYKHLKSLFGPVLKKTGPATFYMGSMVVPAEIDLIEAPIRLKLGHMISLPPLRKLRGFLYTAFTDPSERRAVERWSITKNIFWNLYSHSYDGLLYFYPYKHLIDHVAEKVIQLKPKKVLDLGCGTGNLFIKIQEEDNKILIDAVDRSSQMVRRAQTKAATTERVKIYQNDILLYLKKSNKKYDVVVMNNVLYTIIDRVEFWKLLHKCLNPGGYIVIANPDTAKSTQLLRQHIHKSNFRSLINPRLIAIWVFDGLISLLGIINTYDFTSKNQLARQLKASNFKIIGHIERCYGGHTRGIDLLITAQKQPLRYSNK